MKSKFKIASFNIQHGAIISYNWARLVSPVICIGADLLGVQEVDMGVQRSHCVDTVQEICKALAWKDGRFVRSMSYDGGQYGNAMFGRDRFDTFETCMLPYREDLEPRSCGHATVRLDNGLLLHFFNTHLSYQTEESRFSQFQFIKNAIDCIPENETYIITGDFNTQDESEFTPLLTGRAV